MTEPAQGKLLIVEDNGFFREVMRSLLSQRFPCVEIFEAEDVAEGTREMRRCRPAVVFLDISLRDGNGLDLARRIREELPEACVFICTSHDLPEYRQAAARCGASHFLPKQHLDWDHVGDLVEAELGRRERARGTRPASA